VQAHTCTERVVPGDRLDEAGDKLLQAAFAVNTRKQDSAARGHMSAFAVASGEDINMRVCTPGTAAFERQDRMLKKFVAYMASEGLSHQSCLAYIMSIGRQYLERAGWNPVKGHATPFLCISGLKRMQNERLTEPKKQARALTVDMLKSGMDAIQEEGLARLRMRAILCTGVAFMMRVCEVIPRPGTKHYLRRRGVKFEFEGKSTRPTGMTITIQSQKTNGEPTWRSMGARWDETCCVRAMWHYLEACKGRLKEEDSVFGSSCGLRAVTYQDISRVIKQVATRAGAGDSVMQFTTKAMRRGGVSTLTQKGKVPGYVIGKHGRWSSDTWATIYQELTPSTAKMLARGLSSG
jgi:hypothetical protein